MYSFMYGYMHSYMYSSMYSYNHVQFQVVVCTVVFVLITRHNYLTCLSSLWINVVACNCLSIMQLKPQWRLSYTYKSSSNSHTILAVSCARSVWVSSSEWESTCRKYSNAGYSSMGGALSCSATRSRFHARQSWMKTGTQKGVEER